jgi:hypothetical protein
MQLLVVHIRMLVMIHLAMAADQRSDAFSPSDRI